MNKKGYRGDFEEVALIIIAIIILIVFYWYVIHNPIVRIKDGCWTWQREKTNETFSFINDYNYTCESLRDVLILGLSYDIKEIGRIDRTICKGKILKEKNITFNQGILDEEYVKRCLR